MKEHLEPRYGTTGDRVDADFHYGDNTAVRARFNVYRYSIDGIDFHAEALKALRLDGDETILDVGCNDGTNTLVSLRKDQGHRGQLIGVDINPPVFIAGQDAVQNHNLMPIDFTTGRAEALPFTDNAVDVLLALFVLYHVPNPEDALREFKRVMEPDGTLVVATSGKQNKLRHRKFERDIADYLDIGPPPVFSASFDADTAQAMLPGLFDVTHHYQQSTQIRLDQETYRDYLHSLDAMKNAFIPIPPSKPWLEAIDRVVTPAVLQEIADNGHFTDYVDRHLFICKNKAQN